MVKCDVILSPSLQNPGYASGSLQVRIVVIFDQVQRNLISFQFKNLKFSNSSFAKNVFQV